MLPMELAHALLMTMHLRNGKHAAVTHLGSDDEIEDIGIETTTGNEEKGISLDGGT